MLAAPPPFPKEAPPEYEMLDEEPAFDPARHLALEPPAHVWRLADLGYGKDDIRKCASEIAVAGPFRLLSAEGVELARSTALKLKKSRTFGDRTASFLSGGVYRSRFFRDLCNCPVVAEFLSDVAGCTLLPHSMPSQQLYVNYAPDDVAKAVDTWHVDSIGFDYVLLLNDPNTFSGGRFQFFQGTTYDAARLLGVDLNQLTAPNAKDFPADRVVTPAFPTAGYAMFQQGSLVVHRATRLDHRAERITFVTGLVARDIKCPDPTRNGVAGWDEPGIIAEFARHKAWLSRQKLDAFIEQVALGATSNDITSELRECLTDVMSAIDVLKANSLRTESGPTLP
jgi:hypothetical protein